MRLDLARTPVDWLLAVLTVVVVAYPRTPGIPLSGGRQCPRRGDHQEVSQIQRPADLDREKRLRGKRMHTDPHTLARIWDRRRPDIGFDQYLEADLQSVAAGIGPCVSDDVDLAASVVAIAWMAAAGVHE